MSSGEKEQKRITRREFVKGAVVGAAGVAAAGALASCATPAPEVIKETVEVPVKETVEVPVEVEVTRIVEKEVAQKEVAKEYEVFPPYGHPTIEILQPAPRLDTLEGKTICGIVGGAYHMDEAWPVMVELLQQKYPTAKFVGTLEFIEGVAGVRESAIGEGGSYAHSGKEQQLIDQLPETLKKYGCDAAIVGNGC